MDDQQLRPGIEVENRVSRMKLKCLYGDCDWSESCPVLDGAACFFFFFFCFAIDRVSRVPWSITNTQTECKKLLQLLCSRLADVQTCRFTRRQTQRKNGEPMLACFGSYFVAKRQQSLVGPDTPASMFGNANIQYNTLVTMAD